VNAIVPAPIAALPWRVIFVLLGLAMFGTVPILDATFGQPTPTGTEMSTVDIAFQYDGVADFPLYPVNLLAVLNATAGFWYTHGSYLAPDGRNPNQRLKEPSQLRRAHACSRSTQGHVAAPS
jgi:hypothetical protein